MEKVEDTIDPANRLIKTVLKAKPEGDKDEEDSDEEAGKKWKKKKPEKKKLPPFKSLIKILKARLLKKSKVFFTTKESENKDNDILTIEIMYQHLSKRN